MQFALEFSDDTTSIVPVLYCQFYCIYVVYEEMKIHAL
jgi:hypothetical protein